VPIASQKKIILVGWDFEATTGLLYQPRMIGDDDCGEIGGMKIGKGNLG
jgi:hypothetical protein